MKTKNEIVARIAILKDARGLSAPLARPMFDAVIEALYWVLDEEQQ